MTKSSNADLIWNEIKGVLLNVFGLPGQTVETHCEPAVVEPSKLYLTLKKKNATSVLPSLEEALRGRCVVEQAGRFISVSKI